jgi:hypothetical protein
LGNEREKGEKMFGFWGYLIMQKSFSSKILILGDNFEEEFGLWALSFVFLADLCGLEFGEWHK